MGKDDFLREMYLDTVGHDEAGMKRYERMVNIVSSRFRHGPKTEERAIDEAMQKVISEKYLILFFVSLRLCQFQKMSHAPAHQIAGTFEITIFSFRCA